MDHRRLRDLEETWPVEETSDLHRDGWVVALRADRVRGPREDEKPFRRLVLEHPGAAVVLAADDREQVCCLTQYRHPVGRRLVQLPAGLLDSEEDPSGVAARELREEAGLVASQWTSLGSTYSSPGISSEVMHFFLARGLQHVERNFDPAHEEADMSLIWVPVTDLYDAILEGRVRDASLVVALLLARARGLGTGGAATE